MRVLSQRPNRQYAGVELPLVAAYLRSARCGTTESVVEATRT